jgi:hypothetical protein
MEQKRKEKKNEDRVGTYISDCAVNVTISLLLEQATALLVIIFKQITCQRNFIVESMPTC